MWLQFEQSFIVTKYGDLQLEQMHKYCDGHMNNILPNSGY